jgi:hypothetical protein
VIFKKPVDPARLKNIILQRCRPELAVTTPTPDAKEG